MMRIQEIIAVVLAISVLALSPVSSAQDDETGPVPVAPPVETVGEAAAPPPPPPPSPSQNDQDNFIPTEKINVDSEISFPVDI